MAFNLFPYSNLHNLNLDWILNTVKTMAAAVEAAAATVETYASRLSQVETDVQAITPAATGAVRHDVSQSLDAANRRRAAVNIHAVSYDTVLLSADEKAQARSNIGAISSSDIPPAQDAVLYTEQSLTALQKNQARTNIEAVSSSQYNTLNGRVQTLEGSAVKYTSQILTYEQKAQARSNIGAISAGDIPPAAAAVLYTAQTLSNSQKAQARSNIGAAETIKRVEIVSQLGTIPWYINNYPFATILDAVTNGETVEVFTKPINQNRVYRGIFQLNAAGTHLQADLFALVENPYTSEYTTWYRVDWNSASVLNVTEESGRIAPTCISADAGKVLTVSNSGIPVWVLPFYDVTLTPTGATTGTFSGNFTALANAAQAGNFIRMYMMNGDVPQYLASSFLILFESSGVYCAATPIFIFNNTGTAILFYDNGTYEINPQ